MSHLPRGGISLRRVNSGPQGSLEGRYPLEIDADELGPSEDFEQQRHAVARYGLDEGLQAAQRRILQAHGHAGPIGADLRQLGAGARGLGLADAVDQGLGDARGLVAEHHEATDALRRAHAGQGLGRAARAQEQVAREHGLVGGQGLLPGGRAVRCAARRGDPAAARPAPTRRLEHLEQWQVDLELLAQQVLARQGFLARLGVHDEPGQRGGGCRIGIGGRIGLVWSRHRMNGTAARWSL